MSDSDALSVNDRRVLAEAYDFRRIHPHVRFGTASDRYAGWIGQIYPESWEAEVSTRKRKLGGETFEERTVPVPSVVDYFQHFSVLELDFTFYRPLRKPDGEPSSNYFVLAQYAEHAPDDALFLLKAPQTFFARKLRRSRGGKVSYEDNPSFLEAGACRELFLEPAREILGERLHGVIFEQEYQRKGDSVAPEDNVAELDGFFAQLGSTVQAHLELRSDHFLVPAYFDWLADRGLGFVFSHWTWLPALRDQWKRCGGRFTAANGSVVARLLTPRRVPYAKAYATAYPFDRPVPEITETAHARDMVLDATALVYQAEEQRAILNLIANNRAWGNAPELARTIAQRVLTEEAKRAGAT